MKYYLIPVRMAVIKKQKTTNVGETVKKRKLLHTIGRKTKCLSTMENSVVYLQKIQSRATI